MPLWAACSQCLTIFLVNNLFLIPKEIFLPSNSCPWCCCCAPCRGSASVGPLVGSYPGAVKNETLLMPRPTRCLLNSRNQLWHTRAEDMLGGKAFPLQDPQYPNAVLLLRRWWGLFVFMAHWQGSLLSTDCSGKPLASLPAASVKFFQIPLDTIFFDFENFLKFCKLSKSHYIGPHVLKICLGLPCLSAATYLCLAKLNLMWRSLLTDKSCTCAVGQEECTSRKVGDALLHISCWVC